MSVILSIKPKYCDAISNGNKKYEFRRRIFTRVPEFVYVYSTAPVKKIIGRFAVQNIFQDNPKSLWTNFGDFSGLREEEFYNYFDGAEIGFAIEIKDFQSFKPVDPRTIFSDFHPPQSFLYIDKKINGSDVRLFQHK